MNRPRESILSLFDPLNATTFSTPRNVSSPDSDKENATRDHQLTMTTFFNRIQSPTQRAFCSVPPPLTPRGRLVDVTLDEKWIMELGEGLVKKQALPEPETEEEGLLPLGENGDDTVQRFIAGVHALSGETYLDDPRTPLAEVPFEREIAPIARKRVYRRENLHNALTTSTRTDIQPSTVYPPELSLATVMNSVNGTGASHAKTDSDVAIRRNQVLDTTRCADNDSHEKPSSETGEHHTSTTVISASTNPSSSLDLHASFSLPLHCPDTSFDILCDRVSFSGMEGLLDSDSSFQGRGEDIGMKQFHQKDVVTSAAADGDFGSPPAAIPVKNASSRENTTPPRNSPADASTNDIATPRAVARKPVKKRRSCKVGSPGSSGHAFSTGNKPTSPDRTPLSSESVIPKTAFDNGESDQTPKGRPSSRALAVPGPPRNVPSRLAAPALLAPSIAPAPVSTHVPALRIVKRNKGEKKKHAMIDAGAGNNEILNTANIRSWSTVGGVQRPVFATRHARRVSGLGTCQSLPSEVGVPSSAEIPTNPPQRLMTGASRAPAAISATFPHSKYTSGPIRVPVADKPACPTQDVKMNQASKLKLGIHGPTMTMGGPGPRRVPIGDSGAGTTRAKAEVKRVTGLVLPVKDVGYKGSTLPRPVSRLPVHGGRK